MLACALDANQKPAALSGCQVCVRVFCLGCDACQCQPGTRVVCLVGQLCAHKQHTDRAVSATNVNIPDMTGSWAAGGAHACCVGGRADLQHTDGAAGDL